MRRLGLPELVNTGSLHLQRDVRRDKIRNDGHRARSNRPGQKSTNSGIAMSKQSLFLVTLVVDDYDNAKAFYCDALGFDCLQDDAQPEGKRWLVVRPKGGEGAALLLAKADGEVQQAAIGQQTGGRVGFFLKTDDFDRDHAAMLANGVRFLEAPRREIYGTVAVFADPYGNRWDLIQHSA
jgi:catechol 2,3-dioxygenase-like lactoylglutathione lyase family enzyme